MVDMVNDMVTNMVDDPKRPKMTQNYPKWPKITQNGPNMTPRFTHFFRIFFCLKKRFRKLFRF